MALRSGSFNAVDLQGLKAWSPEDRRNVCLTIWVNSQNLQVAVCAIGEGARPIYLPYVPVTKSSEVNGHFDHLRGNIAAHGGSIIFATMSFAGPVSQDHVVVTNWECEARERVIQFTQLPFDLFPLDRRRFMNDLEAASYGIIAKYLTGSLPAIFAPVWASPDVPISIAGSSLVLSIGSGFGTSFICRHDSSDHNCVVSSEAGHGQAITCSARDPNYDDEVKFIRYVSQRLHGGSHQPEWEDLCAIRGLELAFQWLKHERKRVELDPPLNYDQIRALAEAEEDVDAVAAFKMHYRFVIRAAQTLTLGIQCQRVFLISTRQVRNFEIMKRIGAELRPTFEDHPRPNWFRNIIVYMQKEQSNFSLSGGLFLSRVLAVAHQRQAHASTS
jgi:glucokinase